MTKDARSRYVQRVRALLGGELSAEDLEMLVSDLEDQLAEIDPGAIEDRLGSPETFVDMYLSSAGVEDRPAGPSIGAVIESWLDDRRETPIGARWLRYQEAWWLLRGWVILAGYSFIYGRAGFRPFPIPDIDPYPTTSFLTLVLLTGLSLLLVRFRRVLGGRIANIVLSALAAFMAFVAAMNS